MYIYNIYYSLKISNLNLKWNNILEKRWTAYNLEKRKSLGKP